MKDRVASIALSCIPAVAAGKRFQRSELDEAAIKIPPVDRLNSLPAIHSILSHGPPRHGSIAEQLNERGIRTARGGNWHVSSVANVLTCRLPHGRSIEDAFPRLAVVNNSYTVSFYEQRTEVQCELRVAGEPSLLEHQAFEDLDLVRAESSGA